VFRADASVSLGAGHVMRCLSLAGALSRTGWQVVFACRAGTGATVPLLERSAHEVLDLDGDAAAEARMMAARWPGGCDLLVVDHYQRDAGFETACRPWARRILVIDDLADRLHECDMLLDQTPGRVPDEYRRFVPCECRLLMGHDYALVRPEFFALRRRALLRAENRRVRRVLVALGATDADNVAARVLDGIAASGCAVEVDVVLGAAAPHLAEVRRLAMQGCVPVRVHVDVADMADLMARADVAIGAAGMSSWERCCLGLPALLVIMADNQRDNAQALVNAGAARLLGRGADLQAETVAASFRKLVDEPAACSRMSEAAARLCDGRGAMRVALAVLPPVPTYDGRPVTVRLVEPGDAQLLLMWQRDPRTRRFARKPEIPTPEEHAAWLAGKLADPGCIPAIVLHGDSPAGALRLDRLTDPEGGTAFEISLYIDPDSYRMGIGRAALELARRLLPNATLKAEVLPGNVASQELFKSAGYVLKDGMYVNAGCVAAAELQ
jgi:UDP-2,4-diacetamido-2,4,6-trideoxy-beta-L-altropyranose hydrolase